MTSRIGSVWGVFVDVELGMAGVLLPGPYPGNLERNRWMLKPSCRPNMSSVRRCSDRTDNRRKAGRRTMPALPDPEEWSAATVSVLNAICFGYLEQTVRCQHRLSSLTAQPCGSVGSVTYGP